jgi:hypothetical protein
LSENERFDIKFSFFLHSRSTSQWLVFIPQLRGDANSLPPGEGLVAMSQNIAKGGNFAAELFA